MKKAINPVIELVKAWEVFENENPTGNLEEFCQDYLRKQQLAKFKSVDEGYIHHTGGRVAKPSNGLGKALVRVQKYLHFYIKKTMQNLPIDNIEDFAYLTDVKTIEQTEIDKLKGLKVLVVNALRVEPHDTHFNLQEALDFINLVKPEKAYLTHISHVLGFHEEVQQKLPENVYLAYDNLEITI